METIASLTGPDSEELRLALQSAFPNKKQLEMMLWGKLSFRLSDRINIDQSKEIVVSDLIQEFDSDGKILLLIAAALEAKPNNHKLRNFCSKFSPNIGFFTGSEIQQILQKDSGFLNPEDFVSKILMYERRVCSIQIQLQNDKNKTISGTGFLVGPRIVITNYHVVECIIDHETRKNIPSQDWALPTDLVCHFDFLKASNSKIIREGVKCNLANSKDCPENSPIIGSQSSFVDDYPGNTNYLPDSDDLDIALLFLDQNIGDEIIFNYEGESARGWINIPSHPKLATPGESVIILQHPEGSYLKFVLASNGFGKYNIKGTRMYYSAKTKVGSSGSPCFDIRWNILGVHSSKNRESISTNDKIGIPIKSVIDFINKKEIDLMSRVKKSQPRPPPNPIIQKEKSTLGSILEELKSSVGNDHANRLFEKLYKKVSESNNLQAIRLLSAWFQQIMYNEKDAILDYNIQFTCFNVHICLLGVPSVPPEFQRLFNNEFPETERDAASYLLFASKRIDEHLNEILSLSELLAKGQAPASQRNIKKTLLQILKDFEDEQKELNFVLFYYDCIQYQGEKTSPYQQLASSITSLKNELKKAPHRHRTAAGKMGIAKVNVKNQYRPLKKISKSYNRWLIQLAVEMKNSSILVPEN